MRDSTSIFDQESDAKDDAAADLTREFWGDGAGWIGTQRKTPFQVQQSEDSTRSLRLDHTPASMKAVRDGLAAFRPKRRWRDDSTGPVERTREHGVTSAATAAATTPAVPTAGRAAPRRPSPDRLAHSDASIGDLAAGRFDGAPYPRANGADAHGTVDDDHDLVPLTPSAGPTTLLGSVDPAVLRIGLVVLAVVLAIPLALALRGDDEPTVETDPGAEVVPISVADNTTDGLVPQPESPDPGDAAGVAPIEPREDATGAVDGGVANAAEVGYDIDAEAPDAEAVSTERADTAPITEVLVEPAVESEQTTSTEVPAESTSSGGVVAQTAATVAEEAAREVPDCSRTYTAGTGDSWYRIASEAGVTPAAILEQNRATLDSVIYPDAEICLPRGAAMPTPPTTAAAPAPTTAAPTTAAPTTAAPTTAAPTTTQAPAPPTSSRDEVQALIREIWPDELEERALEVARRESNFYATADNGWCCVGVFQIYWTVHDAWLDDFGINTRNDLKDARKNITAAYALYQSSGGWGPWGG